MSSPIHDIEHGHRETPRAGTAEVPIKGKVCRHGRCPGYGQGDAQDGVGPELGLVGGAIKIDKRLVDHYLKPGILAF